MKKNDRAIQCQLCDLWIHQKCAEMSDVLFKELVFQIENGGGAFWSCKSCRAATAKLNKKITEIYKKVEELETETKDNRIEIQTVKADLADTNRRIDKLSENSRDKEAASHDAVFRELKDREERKNNLLIHNLEEPGPEVRLGKERKEIDIKSESNGNNKYKNKHGCGRKVCEKTRRKKRLHQATLSRINGPEYPGSNSKQRGETS